VALRGDNIDLRGGSIYPWVENADGRWHRTAAALPVGSAWQTTSVLLADTPSEWTRTYDRNGTNPVLVLETVTSFGFSFLGFPRDDPPTGVVCLDDVVLRA